MTFEEEEKFLKQFEEWIKKGELLNTNEMKQEYIKCICKFWIFLVFSNVKKEIICNVKGE